MSKTNDSVKSVERADEARRPQWVVPAVDVYESPTEILVVADVPGVEDSQLDLRVHERTLALTSNRGSQWEYHREFVLPEGLNEEAMRASLDGGILTVHLPRAEVTGPRKIPVAAV